MSNYIDACTGNGKKTAMTRTKDSIQIRARQTAMHCAWMTVSVLASTVQYAQADAAPDDAPLVTDRPDFTESTDAVPMGRFQLEAGYTFTVDREGSNRTRTHSAPELLLRVGLAEDFEIRIGWDGYSWTESQFEERTGRGGRRTRELWSQGANDLSLGFKQKLWEQKDNVPHFGVIGAITVPSGSPSVSSGHIDPEVVLLWAYDLTDTVTLAGNVGFAYPSNEDGRFFQTSGSISVAITLTDRIGSYIEYYGFYPNAEHNDDAHFINGGLTYLISNDVQLDARIGAGLNEEADDFLAGVGFAIRF
jgi:hypothetical protein